jgi:hypothetical protein
MASLVQGGTYRVRYATNTSSSTQKRSERTIEVVEAPHLDPMYQRGGPVVTVKDLTDPNEPGKEKTMYVNRFLTIEAQRGISNRFDRQQTGARSVQWSSDDEEAEPDDGLAVGDLVTIDRRETDGGDTAGNIVDLDATHASVKPAEGHRFKVQRSFLNKTTLASINRKTKRLAASSRRRRGVGVIL